MVKILQKEKKEEEKKGAWYTKSLLQTMCKKKVWNLQVFEMHLANKM